MIKIKKEYMKLSNLYSDIHVFYDAKLMMVPYIWLEYSYQRGEKEEVLPWMLSRDLRSQVSPLCPEEESQIAKIRSPLTPQGEDVKLTAGRGGPQHCRGLTHNPPNI